MTRGREGGGVTQGWEAGEGRKACGLAEWSTRASDAAGQMDGRKESSVSVGVRSRGDWTDAESQGTGQWELRPLSQGPLPKKEPATTS